MTFIPDATWHSDFRACNEFARLRHELQLKPRVVEDAAAKGQAWHDAMRAWFSHDAMHAISFEKTSEFNAAFAELIRGWPEEPMFAGGKIKRPRGLYESLLIEYSLAYPREHDPFKVLSNEGYQEAEFSFGKWCGRPDMRVEWEDGNIYVIDHKSTALYLNEAYFSQWRLSTQMRGYVAMELAEGRRCDGVIIDAVHVDTRYHNARPKKLGKTERNPYLQRSAPIRFREDELKQWERDVTMSLDVRDWLLSKRTRERRWPQNSASCYNFNKRCPYWELCTRPEKLLGGLSELEEGEEYTIPTTESAEGVVTFVRERWNPKEPT